MRQRRDELILAAAILFEGSLSAEGTLGLLAQFGEFQVRLHACRTASRSHAWAEYVAARLALGKQAERCEGGDARATLVWNDGQAQMRDGWKLHPEILVLESRAMWAERVILCQHLAIGAAEIRGDFNTHLLRALLPALLRLVLKTRDPLRVIKLQHNALGRVGPSARPPRATAPAASVDEMLERVIRVLGASAAMQRLWRRRLAISIAPWTQATRAMTSKPSIAELRTVTSNCIADSRTKGMQIRIGTCLKTSIA